MEEKKLDAQESIELIARMIESTRQRLERNTGRPFLIWGYTTVAISLLNYACNICGWNPTWSLSWFLIPVIGILLMRLFPAKKSSEPHTEIDRIIGTIWMVCSLAIIPIFIFSLFHGWSYRPSLFGMIALTMSIATAATGMIVRYRIYTVAGVAGMALSTLFAFHDFYLKKFIAAQNIDAIMLNNEILIFVLIFLVMMIIPGHIANYQSNRANKQ